MLRALRPLRRQRPIAIDLGTARTRVAIARHGMRLDEPTLLAYDRSGAPVAAGWQAWHAAERGAGALNYPVRNGRVVNVVAAVQFVRLLLAAANLGQPSSPAVGLPAGAASRDSEALVEVLEAAINAPVLLIEAPLAAAIGSGLDVAADTPHLMLDVGAGVTELAAVRAGAATVQRRISAGSHDYLHRRQSLLNLLRENLISLLDELPPAVAGDAVRGPLWLVGGGPLLPGLAADLTETLRLPVRSPASPRDAVVSGLALCLEYAPAATAPTPRRALHSTKVTT
jgi:rod shape-determining protein MreB